MAERAKKYFCDECGGLYLATKAGKCVPTCCGKEMAVYSGQKTENRASQKHTINGLRYSCDSCGLELLCIEEGNIPSCCGKELRENRLRIRAMSE